MPHLEFSHSASSSSALRQPTNASLSDVPSCARDFACVLVVTFMGTYPRLGCYLQRLNNILSDAARRHSWQWPWAGFSENRHVYREFPLLCLLRENTRSPLREIAEAWVRIKSAWLERAWKDTCEYVYMYACMSLNLPMNPPIVAPLTTFATILPSANWKKEYEYSLLSFGEDGIADHKGGLLPISYDCPINSKFLPIFYCISK